MQRAEGSDSSALCHLVTAVYRLQFSPVYRLQFSPVHRLQVLSRLPSSVVFRIAGVALEAYARDLEAQVEEKNRRLKESL